MTQLPKSHGERQSRACVMQIVRVSGTIKKAEEEVVRRARAAVLRARREAGEGGLEGLLGDGEGGGVEGSMGVESDGSYEGVEDDGMGTDEDEHG